MKIRYRQHGAKWEVSSKWEDYFIRKKGGEARFADQMLGEVQRGQTFVDIGAANGFYTVMAAKKGCKVVSFEPDLSRYDKLVRNIHLNGLSNKILPFPLAIGDKSLGSKYLATLDELKFEPNHIKIDVEGMEVEVLQGAIQTIKKYQPVLWVELHNDKCQDVNGFFSLLHSMNYQIVDMHGRGQEIHIEARPK